MKSLLRLPHTLIWSLIYGVSGGLLFKLLSVVELWLAANRFHIMQWKRYPDRNYRKFTAAVLMGRMEENSWSSLPLRYNQVLSGVERAPFPILVILCNTLIALLYLPVALIEGIFAGPAFVFRRTWHQS